MIIGGRVDVVEGKKQKEDTIKGLNINITIDGVKVNGNNVEISYTYTATYAEDIGYLTIKGVLFAEEDKKVAKDIADEWQKNKKVPDGYAEIVLNAVNYTGSANGTLIARVLNISPPLVPPKIQITKQG